MGTAEGDQSTAASGLVLKPAGITQSRVPTSCANGEPVVLGIDEAGRGPVLGPMVYGAAYWPVSKEEEMDKKGFDDSKALTTEQRAKLFDSIQRTEDVGWIIRSISAKEISSKMLRRTPYSLNKISFDAAIELIKIVRGHGVNIVKVFVDTVGDPGIYQNYLTKVFEGQIAFTVAKKADSIYKVVSAASICAKVSRDHILENWAWSEQGITISSDYGSGYPGDSRTVAWLEKHYDPVFGFPDIVRFSWSTVQQIFEKNKHEADWGVEDDEDGKQHSIMDFCSSKTKSKRQKRLKFYEDRNLAHVCSFY